jgi:methylthioribose-1-phosphate isomerase
MRLNGRDMRTIWVDADDERVHVIDQTRLPHRVETRVIADCAAAGAAIRDMIVRGAPLIGVTGAYGLALATAVDPSDAAIEAAAEHLLATRPTAVNLRWALDRMRAVVLAAPLAARAARARAEAGQIAEEDVAACSAIGDHGAALILEMAGRINRPLNILTHCNAGWLATVDWGTALAPIYKAARAGARLHVWVDETRPRNQGASLTACELLGEGVPHTVIADNVGGHLMQHGMVDLAIVGSDRTTRAGDVCNKIGTYLKALAAHANGVPFHVALPGSTIDWRIRDGVAEIPIEERDPREVTHIAGLHADGDIVEIRLTPEGTPARNFGFDVTPARYVSGLITERGLCPATESGLAALYPDFAGAASVSPGP